MTINFAETSFYSPYTHMPELPASPVASPCDFFDTEDLTHTPHPLEMLSIAPRPLPPTPSAHAASHDRPAPPPIYFDFTKTHVDDLYAFDSTPYLHAAPRPAVKTEPDVSSYYPAPIEPVVAWSCLLPFPRPPAAPEIPCPERAHVRNVAAADCAASTSPQIPVAPFLDPNEIVIGKYTRAERAAKIARYREKRATRDFRKRILYTVRKKFADDRPRVGGRFIKMENAKAKSRPRRAVQA